MKILVTGATGTVGGATVRALIATGHYPAVMVRNPARIRNLPSGVSSVTADMQKPDTLPAAFHGVDSLFLVTPLAEDETRQGLDAVTAAKDAGVKRIVYLTVHRFQDALHIPHFGSKKPIVEAIEASGLEHTFIEPNHFYENDYWYKDAILQMGVYPQPIGNAGISRVDVRDIAEAAAAALTQPGHEGRHYPLAGPDTLTGEQIAAVWSRQLGKKVVYGGDDLDAWATQARQALPEWLVRDLKIMYAHFQKRGLAATPADFVEQAKILGHAPRSFEAFVAETAQAWLHQN